MPSSVCISPGMPSLCSCMPGYGWTDILAGCQIRENRRYLILLYRILPDAIAVQRSSRVCPRCARACPVTVIQTSLSDVTFAITAGISSSYTASCGCSYRLAQLPGRPSLCSCMPGYDDTDILAGCHIPDHSVIPIFLHLMLLLRDLYLSRSLSCKSYHFCGDFYLY